MKFFKTGLFFIVLTGSSLMALQASAIIAEDNDEAVRAAASILPEVILQIQVQSYE